MKYCNVHNHLIEIFFLKGFIIFIVYTVCHKNDIPILMMLQVIYHYSSILMVMFNLLLSRPREMGYEVSGRNSSISASAKKCIWTMWKTTKRYCRYYFNISKYNLISLHLHFHMYPQLWLPYFTLLI